jgi:hypothetical protein
MGTDWVSLFDMGKCEEIRKLNPGEFSNFIEKNWNSVHPYSLLLCGFREEVPIGTRLAHLRDQDFTDESLKLNLVASFCVSEGQVHLDYWGCFAEVFGANPPGSIAENELFPGVEEWNYILLTSDHVSKILDSLALHENELRVTSRAGVATIREWHSACVRNPRLLIAYFFDY